MFKVVLRTSEIVILSALIVGLANSCPDGTDVYQCALRDLPGVNCTYYKGPPAGGIPVTDGIKCPGPVRNPSVDIVSALIQNSENKCETRFNITWKINPDGSAQYFTGFLLNITFLNNDTMRNILRTFNLSVNDWDLIPLDDTSFRHECVVPFPNTSYNIEVLSLPYSARANSRVSMVYQTSELFDTAAPCATASNPNITFNWTATVGTKVNLAESSIEICFYLAPDAFGFTQYRVTFQLIGAGQLDPPAGQTMFNANTAKNRQLCVTYGNVCPGIYKVWVLPVNDPIGTCRNGSVIMGSCAASEVKPIDMNSSVCNPTTTISVFLGPTGKGDTSQPVGYPSSEPFTQPGSPDAGKIAGIVIGACVAFIIVIVGVFLIRRYHHCRSPNKSSFPITGPSVDPEIPIDTPQSVLIIYSTDSEAHRKVVRNFAAFLHSCCKCDVRYDEWYQVEISQTNPIDWLTKQLRQVKHVIIINSEGGFMQHRGWMDNNQYVLVKDLLLPDLFISAVRQIQTDYFLKKPDLHYYHVSFPYTDQRHLLDTSFGKRYKLMDHIEDLFLNIHGMTKFSSKGTIFANQINSENYMNYSAGRALKLSINEAREYIHGNSGWFKQHYRQSKLTEDANCTSMSHDNDAADTITLTSSIKSLDSNNESKTSDLDVNSIDVGCFPPSPDSSCIGDVDHHSLSPDMGIGCMLEESMFDQTASPIVLCPPSLDDDSSSIGSHSFMAKISEWNEQYDSGLPFSSFELRSNRSSC